MFKQFTREKLANLKFYNLKKEVNKFQIFLLLEIRFSSLCEFQLISTKEPQAQRIDTHTCYMYPPRIYTYRYIYIYIYTQSKDVTANNDTTVDFECDITGNNDTNNESRRCGLFSFFLVVSTS